MASYSQIDENFNFFFLLTFFLGDIYHTQTRKIENKGVSKRDQAFCMDWTKPTLNSTSHKQNRRSNFRLIYEGRKIERHATMQFL